MEASAGQSHPLLRHAGRRALLELIERKDRRRNTGLLVTRAARALARRPQLIRYHASQLGTAGLVTHVAERRQRAGRPPARYFITQPGRDALAALLGDGDSAGLQLEAHRDKAHLGIAVLAQLTPDTLRDLTASDAPVELLVELMNRLPGGADAPTQIWRIARHPNV